MFRNFLIPVLHFSWVCFASAQLAPATATSTDDRELRDTVLPLATAHQGEVAVAIEHLETGESFRHQADMPMPTASLIKFPLMVAVYQTVERGELDLAKPITLKSEDKVPGSGILTDHFSDGVTLPLRDYVRIMMRDSDNTATNIVIDQVGIAATATLMEALGLNNTKLHSKVYRGDTSISPERSKQFGIGSTSANEMVALLRMLKQNKLGNESNTKQMLGHLAACDDSSKLGRYLSTETKLFHKTGAIGNCRTDAGIIETASGPVAVCILTNKNTDQSWGDANEAELLCSNIGRAIVNRFGHDAPSTVLKTGSTGLLVESLQRTLNARLDPSPGLGVDGDFGPATDTAVKRFQQKQGLEPTGSLDPATWKALGALVDEAEITEAPDQFNARVATLPKQPAPASTDPPRVTCKAWAIADAESGEELRGFNSQEKLNPASTTKMMTALLVIEAIAKDPNVANEIVYFSPNADSIIGSSCVMRAGENASVSELLYGLMLPSGNDASIAFAEHFGARFMEELNQEFDNPVDAFVAKMNHRAKELGMDATHFENPHGLTATEHLTTASDLLRLAFAASKLDLFNEVVSTRQHACSVGSEQGYRRTIIWENTNQLLDIEGFVGMKTGTTDAAGACLVTHGSIDGQSRFVVVLGSSETQARYSDSMNLFRWSLTLSP